MEEVKDETAKHFLALNSLLNCVLLYIEYFQHEKVVSGMVKMLTKRIEYAIRHFQEKIIKTIDKKDRQIFADTWEKQDFASVSRVLDIWVDLDDEKRETLEFCARELLAGNFKIEVEDGK